MTAAPAEDPAAGPVDSLVVRWTVPGQLPPAMFGWCARFPAGTETGQDAYLVQPRLRGAVGEAAGRRCPGSEVLPRQPGNPRPARRRLWPPGVLAQVVVSHWPAGPWRRPPAGLGCAGLPSASPGAAADSRWPAARIWRRFGRRPSWRGAWRNSPRSGCAVRRGGRRGSRRPAPCACCAALLSTPPAWYSPRRCRPGCNSAWATPSPARAGWASGQPSCRGHNSDLKPPLLTRPDGEACGREDS